MRLEDNYAAAVMRDLRMALKQKGHLEDAARRALRFLDRRLTDAAKAGCHHCDECEPGTPCWWCGLKSGRRIYR